MKGPNKMRNRGVGNDHAQSRQHLLQDLFQDFVDEERADPRAWQQFCRWAKNKSRLLIERELANSNGAAFWQTR